MRAPYVKKASALVQLMTVVLLQLSMVLPSLARAFVVNHDAPRCRGDHRLCGCAPERVASRTCCCFKSRLVVDEPETTMAHEHHAGHGDDAQRDDDGSIPYLCAAPCGSSPEFISVSLENMKFIRPPLLLPVPSTASFSYLIAQPALPRDCAIDPPDPPPKISLLS